jgi:hypothetical protein
MTKNINKLNYLTSENVSPLIYLFAAYLTTLPIAQKIWHQMVG